MLQDYIYSPELIAFPMAGELIRTPSAGAEIMSVRTFLSLRFESVRSNGKTNVAS